MNDRSTFVAGRNRNLCLALELNMSVRRCDFCKVALVEWMNTWKGGRLPFDFDLVSPAALPEGTAGWLPGRWTVARRDRIAMAPADQYSDTVRASAARVAVVHRCRDNPERSTDLRETELIAA